MRVPLPSPPASWLAVSHLFFPALLACSAPPATTLSLHVGQAALALAEPCAAGSDGLDTFQREVSELKLRVSGPKMRVQQESAPLGDSLTLSQIPVGEDRRVMVTGVDGARTLWRGLARGIAVKSGKTSEITLLMTRIANVTCARSLMASGRAFHSASVLPDGRVLLIGGVSESRATTCSDGSSGCTTLLATDQAELFDPSTGQFAATGSLKHARAFHTAVVLPNGRVIVVGGAASALVDAHAALPMIPSRSVSIIEAYDPGSAAFYEIGQDSDAGQETGRNFAAGILLADGRALISGGIPEQALTTAAGNVRMEALRSSLLCESTSDNASCVSGPALAMRRFGHAMVALLDGSILLVGGSVESGTRSGRDDAGLTRNVSMQGPEIYRDGLFSFDVDRPLFLDGGGRANNYFFTSAFRVQGAGIFIAGGLSRPDDSETFALTGPSEQVWYLEESQRYFSPGKPNESWRLGTPRFMLGAVPLGDGSRVLLAGGFESLNPLRPSSALEFVDGPSASIRLMSENAIPRALRQARGGAGFAGLSAGTALVTGGISALAPSEAPISSAEIFTDAQEPSP